MRCLNHLSWTFLAMLRCPGSSGVHCSASRRRKVLCQSVSHCVLAAERHCLVLVSLSAGACCLLPRLTRAASSSELIPSPSPDHRHSWTQPLPGSCCCCGQRVGLILARCRIVAVQFHQLWTCASQRCARPQAQLSGGGADTKDPALREQSCHKGNVPSQGHVKQ